MPICLSLSAFMSLTNLQHFLIYTLFFRVWHSLAGYTLLRWQESKKIKVLNKTGKLCTHSKLHQSLFTRHLFHIMKFISIQDFFVLPTNATMTYAIDRRKMTMNNHNSYLSGSNMSDLWVIQWLCSRACDSESDYPWQNICDSKDIKNIPSVTSLVTPN